MVHADELLDDRYRLGDSLGRGGMADVYEAEDLRLDRQVAVKRYRSGAHGVGLRRFMGEAELLARLSHPGLLTIYDVSHDGERPFLVLQLAPGGTLRDRLNDGPLPPVTVAQVGAELAGVLAYVHANGIVHRDMKPSNVLFGTGDDCYLADFGIARALGAAHLTDSAEFVGTAAYLAPEQVVDREPGPPADIYALGLVLLECLTGKTEYAGTDVEMALARLSRPPRIPATWGPQWRSVLSAMTATDPADRPDATRCAKLLAAIEPGATRSLRVPITRKARTAYAGLAAIAATAAAALLLITGPTPTSGTPVGDPTQSVPATLRPLPEQGAPVETVANTGAPTAEVPAADQPAAGQPVGNQPAGNQPAAANPATPPRQPTAQPGPAAEKKQKPAGKGKSKGGGNNN
jgi:tRNA A-37 threonylcarbamoyl transferase component Bud32